MENYSALLKHDGELCLFTGNDVQNMLNEKTTHFSTRWYTFLCANKHTKSRSYIANTKHGGIRNDSSSSLKFDIPFYLGQKPRTKPALNPLLGEAISPPEFCDHSPFK